MTCSKDINARMAYAPVVDFSQLWNWCEYPLASNQSERTRFVNFMMAGTRTPAEVHTDFESSVKRWLVQQSRAPPRRQRDSDNSQQDSINVIADRITHESSSDRRQTHLTNALTSDGLDLEAEANWRVCYQCLMTTAR